MYERITIRHPHPYEDFITINETKQLPDTEQSRRVLNRLCDLEDKIEQGKIVELPCRVGQKVYVLSRYCGAEWKVYEFRVYEYTIYEHNILMRMANSDYNFGASVLEIGVSVFLDRAEAEAKLREMEGDKNA